jgi:hypothetical protein
MAAEKIRLEEAREQKLPWKKWGPYLSERQWGTVREDYSDNGDAWNYFTHDQARSRAYRWGEVGLAGVSDDHQVLCFALALWNEKDPILKERLFGLTNSEGNHGEDVKEYYFYLDSTPTHSYMKYLYKYPPAAPIHVLALVIRALLNYYLYYGGSFQVECPTGSGRFMNLFEVAWEISARLTRIFLRDGHGRRPVFGGTETFQSDSHWRDCVLFYEYFHADNGAGLGASHQTGWTGIVARLIQLFGQLDPQHALAAGKMAGFERAGAEKWRT